MFLEIKSLIFENELSSLVTIISEKNIYLFIKPKIQIMWRVKNYYFNFIFLNI